MAPIKKFYYNALFMASTKESACRIEEKAQVHTPTFHLFSKFPQELQDKIWETAVADHEPRNVEVVVGWGGTTSFPTLAPALLHVCSASRSAGLKRYERLRSIFVDWELDTIFFDDGRYNHLDNWIATNSMCPTERQILENARNVAMFERTMSQLLDDMFMYQPTSSFHISRFLRGLHTIKLITEYCPYLDWTNAQFIPEEDDNHNPSLSNRIMQLYGKKPQFVYGRHGGR